MKKIVIIMIGLMSLSAGAQKLKENEVPKPVKDAFMKDHQNVKEVKWEKEMGNYEAEYEVGETEHSILFDAKGAVLEMEVEVPISELPGAASEYIVKNYNDAKIKEVEKITDAGGMISYEVEIKGKDLLFDTNGKFIKEEKDTGGDDKD